jgi:hypothetical protein
VRQQSFVMKVGDLSEIDTGVRVLFFKLQEALSTFHKVKGCVAIYNTTSKIGGTWSGLLCLASTVLIKN